MATEVSEPDLQKELTSALYECYMKPELSENLLKEKRDKIDYKNFKVGGQTLLFFACANHHQKLIATIIECFKDQIDINHKNGEGLSCVMVARVYAPTMQLLLDNFADIDFFLPGRENEYEILDFCTEGRKDVLQKIFDHPNYGARIRDRLFELPKTTLQKALETLIASHFFINLRETAALVDCPLEIWDNDRQGPSTLFKTALDSLAVAKINLFLKKEKLYPLACVKISGESLLDFIAKLENADDAQKVIELLTPFVRKGEIQQRNLSLSYFHSRTKTPFKSLPMGIVREIFTY